MYVENVNLMQPELSSNSCKHINPKEERRAEDFRLIQMNNTTNEI